MWRRFFSRDSLTTVAVSDDAVVTNITTVTTVWTKPWSALQPSTRVSDRRSRMRRAAAREVERRDAAMAHTPGSRRASSMCAEARRENRIVASCARAPRPTPGARTRRLDAIREKREVPHVSLSVSGAARHARRERRGAGEKGPTAVTHLPVDVYAGNRSDEHPSSATRVALCRRAEATTRRSPDKKRRRALSEFDGKLTRLNTHTTTRQKKRRTSRKVLGATVVRTPTLTRQGMSHFSSA